MGNDNLTPAALPHDATNEPASRAAAERLAAEMAGLIDQDTDAVNMDVSAAVTQTLGLWDKFRTYLPAIMENKNVDGVRVSKLRDYALNLIYWQGSATYAAAPADALTSMIEKGMALRDRTLADLAALANHGVLDSGALTNFRGTNSHRKLAQDLIGLSNLVHERWALIGGKSMISLASMDEAATLGEAILQGLGDRERMPTHSLVQRDKAFTLFVRAYDEARRAILFLRWHEGDADTILPSLYKGRRSAKKRESDTDGAPRPPVATPAAQAAAPQTSSLLVAGADEDDDA